MLKQLFLILDYPKSASSSLEQTRIYHTTQVIMSQTLYKKNL